MTRLLSAKGGRTVCTLFYEAEIRGGELTLSAESLDLAWFDFNAIPWEQLAFIRHKEALREWIDSQH